MRLAAALATLAAPAWRALAATPALLPTGVAQPAVNAQVSLRGPRAMAKGAKETSLRPSYLSADVFVSALIDFFAQRYLHGGKPPTPAEFVSGLETAAATAPPPTSLNENLVGSLRALLPGAELDWPAFEKRLCAWYDAVLMSLQLAGLPMGWAPPYLPRVF